MTHTPLFLLDTNITGYIVSGRSLATRDRFKQSLKDAVVMISTITEAEIMFGLERKPDSTRLRTSVSALLETVQIRPWDSAAAHAYARLRTYLKTSGKALAEMDLLIASHAIAANAVLVSHDTAFHHVAPFVRVVDWATDL